MTPWLDNLLPQLPVWMLVMFRFTGLFVLAPLFSSASIPGRIKVLWAAALSLAVYPVLTGGAAGRVLVGAIVQGGLSLWTLPVAVGLELLIGAVIGYGAMIPLAAAQLAGQHADQQLGTGLAGLINPELGDEGGGIFAQFYFIVAMMIFLSIDGQRAVLGTLLHSFQDVPLGGLTPDGRLLDLAAGLLSSMFEVALRIAAPLLCLVFLETVAMGFLARTVPQMNLLSIGFPLRIVAGVALLIACLPSHSGVLADFMRESLQRTATWLGG